MLFGVERTEAKIALALVLLATFTVTLGYGVILPVVPFYLQHLAEHGGAFSVSWHTGILTGLYSFTLFLFAPMWGKLSDRTGHYRVLLFGLGGFSIGMLWFALSPNLASAYASRAVTGFCAAAVLPTTLAAVVTVRASVSRARAVATINAANAFGFLAGPALASAWTWNPPLLPFLQGWWPTGFNVMPIIVVALIGFATSLVVAVWWRNTPASPAATEPTPSKDSSPSLATMLAITFSLMFALGSFEVSYTVLAQQKWQLASQQVAGIFVACSIIMILAQLFLFAPLLQRFGAAGLTIPSVFLAAAGIGLLPEATQYAWQVSLVSLIALGTGLAVPSLAYSISLVASNRQGHAFGQQIAVTSLGQALGAGIVGVLFDRNTAMALWMAAGLLVLGAAWYALQSTVWRTADTLDDIGARSGEEKNRQ
ncbi:MFS transporter [Permianibacter sp. IMCC34836]|uniref:MFS transporter n=1 Tax=Permianibacter fluminis TaxID=2738515 RepID=UPI0015561D6E|nr:MFS transporter [Permianibacter fluminis]NQD37976.1 MFS transporter [Permianibacter fluminis]